MTVRFDVTNEKITAGISAPGSMSTLLIISFAAQHKKTAGDADNSGTNIVHCLPARYAREL